MFIRKRQQMNMRKKLKFHWILGQGKVRLVPVLLEVHMYVYVLEESGV